MAHDGTLRFRRIFARPRISGEKSVGYGPQYRFALSRPTQNPESNV